MIVSFAIAIAVAVPRVSLPGAASITLALCEASKGWWCWAATLKARVGLNEQEAKAQGIPYEVALYGIDDLDRAIADNEAHGFVKVLTVPGKDKMLGVTIVGEHAGDLLAEYVLALRCGVGLNKMLATSHIYPTLAEANKYAAGVWKKAHVPAKLLAWLERFHA